MQQQKVAQHTGPSEPHDIKTIMRILDDTAANGDTAALFQDASCAFVAAHWRARASVVRFLFMHPRPEESIRMPALTACHIDVCSCCMVVHIYKGIRWLLLHALAQQLERWRVCALVVRFLHAEHVANFLL
jgi:hypothetical protein